MDSEYTGPRVEPASYPGKEGCFYVARGPELDAEYLWPDCKWVFGRCYYWPDEGAAETALEQFNQGQGVQASAA